MRGIPLACLALLVLAALGGAQSPVVLPAASLATALGSTNNNIPFSWTPARYQQIFDQMDVGPANVFWHLQMRPASTYGNPSFGGHMVDLELSLGPTLQTWSNPSSSFAVNNPNPSLVLKRCWVQMPHFRTETPQDWQVTIPFDRPYIWPGQANLCIEAANWGNTNGDQIFTYPLDAVDSASGVARTCRVYALGSATAGNGTPHPSYGIVMRLGFVLANNEAWLRTYGTGCSGAAGEPVNGLKEAARVGASLNFFIQKAAPSSAAALILGASRSGWASFQLPLDLGAFGAQGCSLNASLAFLFGTGTDSSGKASIGLLMPGDPLLLGAHFFTQWLVVDAGANPLGLVFSQGGEALIGK